jgi:glycosyltransferase involved in cell wall biosynthesis
MIRCAVVPPVPVPYREQLFARLAAREGIELEVIYQAASQRSWDQAASWFPDRHGYAAVHLSSRHLPRRGRSPITWPRGLERALEQLSPDVVVVSEFGPAALRALAWCRARGRAFALLTEVTAQAARSLSPPQRLVHRWLARRADGLIAVSSAARARLLALGVDARAVAVSLQAIDEDALRSAAAARRPVDAVPAEVLTVARLVPDKDVAILIDAFAAAGLSEREATLAIAGGGPMEPELRARARALGVPARFLGPLPAGELPARYAAASVFVLPSRYEPFGVSLREALVAGLPLICTTAVGAAPDLAHEGANAILFAPGDVRALAEALARVCRDPALRLRMGAESLALAAAHPLEADVEAFAAVVSRAAREARARR